MKKEGILKKQLCLPYCPYYKPGKNEELACRGYGVVERLLEGGKHVSFPRSGKGRQPVGEAVSAVREQVCTPCAFHDEDCDFILTGGSASPCGGFLLLAYLLEAGEITIDDIQETVDKRRTP